ncbi:MAG TPA: hypothetical protein VGD94_24655 [Vicinamibacterales bacterium]
MSTDPLTAIGAPGEAGAEDPTSRAPVQVPDSSAPSAATVPALSPSPADSEPIPQRGPGGRFLPGNRESRKHGLFGARVSAALIAEREAFEAACLADDGGDVPVRRAARLQYRARLHVQIRALSDALEQFGLFDRRGRLRGQWLQRLEGLIAVATRLDATLGDERRARDISRMSAAEYAALQERARDRE